MKIRILSLIILILFLSATSIASADSKTIVVIPKATLFPFWEKIHEGAEESAKENGVLLIWRGPRIEGDIDSQRYLINYYCGNGEKRADALVIAPINKDKLTPWVDRAAKKGCPVVIIDSPISGDKHISYISTDNYKSGRAAAKLMAHELNFKGKIVLFKLFRDSSSTELREQGFADWLKDNAPEIKIIGSIYSSATLRESKKNAATLLEKYPDVNGIFSTSESGSTGMLKTLQKMKNNGKIKFIGFDFNETLIDGLRRGDITALVIQSPYSMGYLGIKTAVQATTGKKVPSRIESPFRILTPEAVKSPDYLYKIINKR